MKLAVLKETRSFERRVAATPETVKKLKALGFDVHVQAGAGLASSYTDVMYTDAGATVAARDTVLAGAKVVLKVQRPDGTEETNALPEGSCLIAMLNPYGAQQEAQAYVARYITAMALEFVPRITRAQSMDVLSSQSNLAGYRAVLDAAYEFGRGFPMMMTAAGTVPPAKVMVMGAGVAGLQAIATARRLGAVVCATDVRMAAKEQVKSLGASFVMVEDEETKAAETAGGYAKEMSESYKQKQATLIAETIKKQDIVICTALIPGRAAPRLVTEAMVRSMKPGSVIVDLAVEQGGNCECGMAGQVVEVEGVKIVGHRNVPSRIAVDASALYARNVLSLLTLLVDAKTKQLAINWDDEIVKAITLTRDGAVVHPQLKPQA